MVIINRLISFLVGIVFIFSGTVKLIDPVGLQIKLGEYFEVFMEDFAFMSGFWEFWIPYSLWLGIFLSTAEVTLGLSLILLYRIRFTLWALMALVVFFGFLTFYSAYYEKVTDCGCFGDAIPLTPWQSFYKDMILLVLLSVLFFQKKPFSKQKPTKLGNISIIFATFACIFLAIYSIRHLPVIDFRAYKVGANIPELLKPSEDLKYDKGIFVYTNLKTGKDERFEEDKWDDKYSDTTKYKYKAYERKLLNPEAQAKITDYSVWKGDDIYTEETFKGKKLLIIVPEAKKANIEGLKNMLNLTKKLENTKTKVMLLTGSDSESFAKFKEQYDIEVPDYSADKKVLKTMVRANPGLILMKEGIVVNKWHYNDVPDLKELEN